MSGDKLIYEFSKNAGQKVVLQFREFRKRRFFDIRIFYLSEDGSWRPTPKGISLRRELISELKEGINRAEACVEDGDQGPDRDAEGEAAREGSAEDKADE